MTTTLIVLLIVFTCLSGFFSGSETALFSLSSMRVRAFRRAPQSTKRLIARLLARPRELLSTILMLNVIANILVQNISSALFADVAGWGLKVGLPLVLTLLFGEIIPKTVAFDNNAGVASFVSRPIGLLHWLLSPIRRVITWITSYISRAMFFFLKRSEEISIDELKHALATSEEHDVLHEEEADLIRGYLTFGEVSVKELARPREEFITFDLKAPLSSLPLLFKNKECSRVPVCEDGIENIIGIIEAGDYFLAREKITSPKSLRHHLRKPFFIPETMSAKALLNKFEERDESMAIVVDEYGSISGLITREDLVEVVVGEIADRRDDKARFTRAGTDVIIASGKLELAELNELFNTDLKSESSIVTIGGYLTEQIGELPKAGTRYLTDHLLFHVLAADPNRVRRIYIRRLKEEES